MVSYRVEHWRRNSISTCAHVIFSIYHLSHNSLSIQYPNLSGLRDDRVPEAINYMYR